MLSRSALVLVVLLGATRAHAQEATWDKSFPADAIKSYLPKPGPKVMVIRGGELNDDLTGAATALIVGIKAAGASQVLEDSSLGDVSTLTDPQLVERAQGAADQVAVVRVDADASSGQPRAVVTAYDMAARPLATFAVVRGATLLPKGSAPAVAAVQPQTAPPQPPTPAMPAQPLRPPAPTPTQLQYQSEMIGYGTYARMSPWYGPVYFHGAYEGLDHRPISIPDFFERVGRHDLSESYSSRQTTRDVLTFGGAAVILGSMIVGGILISEGSASCDQFGFCTAQSHSQQDAGLLVALGGSAAGLVAIGVGYGINPMPVSETEMKGLAEQHNQQLRQQLHLGASSTSSSSRPLALHLSPTVRSNGGGLRLGFDF